MSAIYTPTPVQQKTYTEPSDGDLKPVASIDAFLQGLADGAAAAPLIPFNWHPPVTSPHGLNRGWFSVKEQAWYAVGDNVVDALDVSYTDGRTWKSLTASLGTGLTLLDVASDKSGNVVIVASGGFVTYQGTYVGYGNLTWAVGSPVTASVDEGRLTYDEVHLKWAFVYRHSTAGLVLVTKPWGSGWTSQALPATWTGYTGTGAFPQIHCSSTGTMVAAFLDFVAGDKIRIIRSTDGGTTWVDVADITTSVFTPAPFALSIAHDAVYGVWYVTASDGSATEVYRSLDDGVTWPPVSTMPGGGFTEFQLFETMCLCGVLIGLDNQTGRVFFSSDLGLTWWFATSHKGVSGSPTGLRKGDGRLLVFDRSDATVSASLRYGPTGLEVV